MQSTIKHPGGNIEDAEPDSESSSLSLIALIATLLAVSMFVYFAVTKRSTAPALVVASLGPHDNDNELSLDTEDDLEDDSDLSDNKQSSSSSSNNNRMKSKDLENLKMTKMNIN